MRRARWNRKSSRKSSGAMPSSCTAKEAAPPPILLHINVAEMQNSEASTSLLYLLISYSE